MIHCFARPFKNIVQIKSLIIQSFQLQNSLLKDSRKSLFPSKIYVIIHNIIYPLSELDDSTTIVGSSIQTVLNQLTNIIKSNMPITTKTGSASSKRLLLKQCKHSLQQTYSFMQSLQMCYISFDSKLKFANKQITYYLQLQEQIQLDNKSFCRICETKISINIMHSHSSYCLEKAMTKKCLIEENLALATISEHAYVIKHDIQIKYGMKLTKELKKQQIKTKYETIRDDEISQIMMSLTQIYSFAEKVFNQPQTEEIKSIYFIQIANIALISQLTINLQFISNKNVRSIILEAQECIKNRTEHMKRMQQLEMKLNEQQVNFIKKNFVNKANSISFVQSRFGGHQNKSLLQNKTNLLQSLHEQVPLIRRSTEIKTSSPSMNRKPINFGNKLSQFVKQEVSESESDHSDDSIYKPKQIIKTEVYDEESPMLQQQLCQTKGYNSDTEVVTFNAEITKNETSIKDFEMIKPLGQGAFGGVILAKKKTSKDMYAIKIIDCSNQSLDSLKAERNIFEILTGEFVVKAYYSFTYDHYYCFVQEYMVGGDFSNILKIYSALDQSYTQFYVAEIVLALEYLRKNQIVHRDLKPDNILLDQNGHAKLADFGLSAQGFSNKLKKQLQKQTTKQIDIQYQPIDIVTEFNFEKRMSQKLSNKKIVGTPDYISPEILRGDSSDNFSTDYWSLGVILYEMLVGIPPFNDDSIEKIFDNILNKRMVWPDIGEEEDCITPVAADLIDKLMEPDFRNRLGHNDIEEIKRHPFFEGINWSQLRKQQGLIVPRMIMNFDQKSNNHEKVDNFLKNLNKKDNKYEQIAYKLKNELKNFERLDLLQHKTLEEAQLKEESNSKKIVQIQQKIQKLKSFCKQQD